MHPSLRLVSSPYHEGKYCTGRGLAGNCGKSWRRKKEDEGEERRGKNKRGYLHSFMCVSGDIATPLIKR